MTKPSSMLLVTVLAIVLAGCNRLPIPGLSQQSASESQPAADTQNPITEGGKRLAEIAADLQVGAGYRCTFVDPDTQAEMSYLLKGKQISMTITGTDPNASGPQMSRLISDGTTIYMWDPATKKGMKMTAEAPEGQEDPSWNIPDFSNPEEIAELEQQYQVSCDPAVVSDGEFTAPSDVEFQDMAQLMQMMQQQQPAQ